LIDTVSGPWVNNNRGDQARDYQQERTSFRKSQNERNCELLNWKLRIKVGVEEMKTWSKPERQAEEFCKNKPMI
jgi:hypothetical protein